jgi:hypothetical protein
MNEKVLDEFLSIVIESQAAKLLLETFRGSSARDMLLNFIEEKADPSMDLNQLLRIFIRDGIAKITDTPNFSKLFNVAMISQTFKIHPSSVNLGLGLVYHYVQITLWNPEWYLDSVLISTEMVSMESIRILEKIENGRLFIIERFLFRKILIILFNDIHRIFGESSIDTHSVNQKLVTFNTEDLVDLIKSPLLELSFLLNIAPGMILESMYRNPQKYIGFE